MPLNSETEARVLAGPWEDERTLRDRDWKLYVSVDAPLGLCHVSQDPGETRDLASDGPQPLGRMAQGLAEAEGVGALSQGARATVEHPRAVGYLEEDVPR